MSLDDRQKIFIGYLLNLAKEGQEDRGALADLRSGLGKEPGQMARVHKHVVPYLPEQRYNDRWYYVTATLFGSFPKHRKGHTLGKAFKPLAFPPGEKKKESMEARFVALLNAHPDDLAGHLRHAVSLLKANEQPLDWFRLLEDLLQWDDPDGHVQLKWARDFYKSNNSSGGDTSQASTTSEKKEIESHE
ncbi:MAG: type I-E CRISPR-associated protein Cse2/CasB [Syntrophobacteraceae bacterium]|jgi:CRISPR system Cascade subunit CasB